MQSGNVPERISEYLEIERENESISAELHQPLMEQFRIVNRMIGACLDSLRLDTKEASMVAQLYSLVHYLLFASFSNLMRLHLSEALSCERKAIDATLTAYEIQLNPSSLTSYEKREWRFQNIKSVIQKARSTDATSYPLAAPLLTAHDLCSQFGAHADISTFIFRMLDHRHQDHPSLVRQQFLYFQLPESHEQASLDFLHRLHHFLLMTKVFDPFTTRYSTLKFSAWEKDRNEKIDVFAQEISRLRGDSSTTPL